MNAEELQKKFEGYCSLMTSVSSASRNWLEKIVLKAIDKYPEILQLKNDWQQNIAMIACENLFENIANRCANNADVVLHQDKQGMTLGMYAIQANNEKLALKCAKVPTALEQIDITYSNMGLRAAKMKIESIVLLSLENKIASNQIDFNGDNIGILCAKNKLENATMKALDNPKLSTHQNAQGENIGICAAKNFMIEAVKKASKNIIALGQKDNLGRTMNDYVIGFGIDLNVVADEENMNDAMNELYERVLGKN